ncbi:MAG TPA: RluA family pseudouridine synthase, partial [Bacilli bacterium]|nr:RluA family pseudouridine synthase [Bacilli bacterium]
DKDDVVKNFLKRNHISKRLGRKIKWNGTIYINGLEAGNWFSIHPGDVLEIHFDEEINSEIVASPWPVEVLFEDEYLLVVNKPANLASQPSHKYYEDNLISRLKFYFEKNNINSNVHLVNRLDLSTSGLVLVAKNGFVHHLLMKTAIDKKYLAVVEGKMPTASGVIALPIERDNHPIKRKVSAEGKHSVTEFRVIKSEDQSLLELTLRTGRCHQIRVHLSSLKHPIVGDKLYGTGKDVLMLHAFLIKFIHPFTNKVVKIVNYPDWLKNNDHLWDY